MKMHNHRILFFCIAAFFLLFSTSIAKIGGGLNLFVSSPQEEFANVSDMGGGISGKLFATPPGINFFALRVDFAWVSYESETNENIHIPETGLYVDVNTSHESMQFTLGPQFSAPAGPLLLYFAPMAGVYNYSTTEEIEESEISKEKWSITKFGWNVGGGIMMKIMTFDKETPKPFTLSLDIGMKYHTVKNIIPSAVIGGDRDANDLTFHLGAVLMTK